MPVGQAAYGASRGYSLLRRLVGWVAKKKRRKYAVAGAAAGGTVGGIAGWKARKKYQRFGGNIVLPDYNRRRY